MPPIKFGTGWTEKNQAALFCGCTGAIVLHTRMQKTGGGKGKAPVKTEESSSKKFRCCVCGTEKTK